jgi:hypothetical protein
VQSWQGPLFFTHSFRREETGLNGFSGSGQQIRIEVIRRIHEISVASNFTRPHLGMWAVRLYTYLPPRVSEVGPSLSSKLKLLTLTIRPGGLILATFYHNSRSTDVTTSSFEFFGKELKATSSDNRSDSEDDTESVQTSKGLRIEEPDWLPPAARRRRG